MERGFSMTDNTKYEVNRRYPLEENTCPVDGEAVVTVWSGDKEVTREKAKWFSWCSTITHFLVLEYPPEKNVRWVNVYGDGYLNSCFYKTREQADEYASKARTECIKVEYMDGEGL